MKKITLFYLFLFQVLIAKPQDFFFSSPVKIQATEKVTTYIRKGLIYSAVGLSWNVANSAFYIFAKDSGGVPWDISFKDLRKFEFIDIDNIEKVWIGAFSRELLC